MAAPERRTVPPHSNANVLRNFGVDSSRDHFGEERCDSGGGLGVFLLVEGL